LIEVRCSKCNKKLAMLNGQAEIKCPRCGNIEKANTIIINKQSDLIATK
jgi:phage FluMu protein Com